MLVLWYSSELFNAGRREFFARQAQRVFYAAGTVVACFSRWATRFFMLGAASEASFSMLGAASVASYS